MTIAILGLSITSSWGNGHATTFRGLVRALAAQARTLGYGEDTEALSREHELLHTFLMEAVGFGSSPTLWAVAHGQQGAVAPIWAQEEEETRVLSFQAYLNCGEASPVVCALGGLGLNIETLRRDVLQRLRSE